MSSDSDSRPTARALRGLRLQLFIVIAMLALEIVLGVAVNLFARLPAGDKGTSLFAAFGAAIGSGPVSLALHAIVGALLVLAGISVIVRAARIKIVLQLVLAIVGMLALLGAWSAGTGFVGHQVDGASFGMALASCIALLAYASALFAIGAPHLESKPAAS